MYVYAFKVHSLLVTKHIYIYIYIYVFEFLVCR